jgi:small nuclear ribonucleoprotein (snRNP)-like protein
MKRLNCNQPEKKMMMMTPPGEWKFNPSRISVTIPRKRTIYSGVSFSFFYCVLSLACVLCFVAGLCFESIKDLWNRMASASSSVDRIQSMLGKPLRIIIADGRLVQGELQCFDKDKNFILGNATEYYGVKDGQFYFSINIYSVLC